MGPYLEFANYQALVDGTTFKASSPEASKEAGSKRVIPKGRKRVAYRKMITGLVSLYLFVTYGPRFNYSVAVQPWYAEQPLWYRCATTAYVMCSFLIHVRRIGFFQIAGFFERTKYYAIWTLTEVCHLAVISTTL